MHVFMSIYTSVYMCTYLYIHFHMHCSSVYVSALVHLCQHISMFLHIITYFESSSSFRAQSPTKEVTSDLVSGLIINNWHGVTVSLFFNVSDNRHHPYQIFMSTSGKSKIFYSLIKYYSVHFKSVETF